MIKILTNLTTIYHTKFIVFLLIFFNKFLNNPNMIVQHQHQQQLKFFINKFLTLKIQIIIQVVTLD
jgi:hypothetical protein